MAAARVAAAQVAAGSVAEPLRDKSHAFNIFNIYQSVMLEMKMINSLTALDIDQQNDEKRKIKHISYGIVDDTGREWAWKC